MRCHPGTACSSRNAPAPAVSGRQPGRRIRHGLLLGRGEALLAAARCRFDSGGLLGRLHAKPTYEEVCTGRTGHIETVRVIFDPKKVSYGELLKLFWEEHDPTQGMRQGNDHGTQYRSAILTHGEAQQREAEASRDAFQAGLKAAGQGTIATEIHPAPEFYFAEAYHQQYLNKVPNGYCPNHSTGVTCLPTFSSPRRGSKSSRGGRGDPEGPLTRRRQASND